LSEKVTPTDRKETAMDLEFLVFADAPPPPPTAPYSHAVRAGNFLFVTGQLGVDPTTNQIVARGVVAQTRQVMTNLQTVLRGAGTSLDRAVMVRVYLVNFADYAAMNAEYASFFAPGRYPSRTTVGVTGLALGGLVEIDLIVRP
jgi:2-iminobutanoate/2-iminopropanoate deaminase